MKNKHLDLNFELFSILHVSQGKITGLLRQYSWVKCYNYKLTCWPRWAVVSQCYWGLCFCLNIMYLHVLSAQQRHVSTPVTITTIVSGRNLLSSVVGSTVWKGSFPKEKGQANSSSYKQEQRWGQAGVFLPSLNELGHEAFRLPTV